VTFPRVDSGGTGGRAAGRGEWVPGPAVETSQSNVWPRVDGRNGMTVGWPTVTLVLPLNLFPGN
jgi:hypothetical protein